MKQVKQILIEMLKNKYKFGSFLNNNYKPKKT